MIERIRDLGPVVLVPAAWVATAGAVFDRLGDDGMLIAHLVMAVFIAFFLVTGWRAMSSGALRAWRAVMVAGLPVTLAGLAGFLTGQPFLFAISLVGWMCLPAAGLAYTARELPEARLVYGGGAVLSVAGTLLTVAFLAGMDESLALLGIVLVGIGHTAGIADASIRDAR